MIYLFEEVLNFSDNETVFLSDIWASLVSYFSYLGICKKMGVLNISLGFFYGSQVTRKTGEILDSLHIFFMIEFFFCCVTTMSGRK